MQYIYTECKLPSNGKIYDTTTVHIRPKTIFDIKNLLNNFTFMLKSEIDTLQNCIDPKDNIDVYDLVSQDVVYLLYKLRSLSDDILHLNIKNRIYDIKISELDVKYLDNYNNKYILPDSGLEVILKYQPIKNTFNIEQLKEEFESKYPEYSGDVYNTLRIINSIESINNSVNVDIIRTQLEQLSWKDSIYLIDEINKFNNKPDFGIIEEIKLNINGKDTTIPIQITEEFFRPAL